MYTLRIFGYDFSIYVITISEYFFHSVQRDPDLKRLVSAI